MQTTHTWFCKTWTVNTRGNESKFVEWNICYVFRPWCVCAKWELSLVEAFFCCCQRWANEKWKHFSENVTYFEDTNTEQHRMNNTAGKAYTHSTLIFDDAKMWFSLLSFFAVGERIYLRTTYGIVCYVFILLCLDFVGTFRSVARIELLPCVEDRHRFKPSCKMRNVLAFARGKSTH